MGYGRRYRGGAVVMATVVAMIGFGNGPVSAAPASGLTAVTPERLVDTRIGLGGSVVAAGEARSLQVSGHGGVPATGAIAVVLNVTVTEPTSAGYVTVFPGGVERPTASNVNFLARQTVPNLVTVGLGGDGRVELFSSTTTHLLVDVVGWYASGLQPVTPGRLMDTRTGLGGVVLGPGETRVLQVAGSGGVPSTGVGAVALNVTVTEPTGPGFVTVWPSGVERPTASNLNFVAGQTVANAVLVGVSPSGSVSLFNSSTSTHLVVDVDGWFASGFQPVTPARLMDTRASLGGTLLGPGETRELTVVGVGGVPSTGVGAVALNVTATEPTLPSYVTAWPSGAARPTASNLNVIAGQTVPNAVVVGVGTGGRISLYNNSGTVQLVVDVTGWFPAATGDVTAPVLSNLSVGTITSAGATVTWTTNEPASTQIDWGTTTSYGSTSLVATLTTGHSATLTGLSPSTTYHYRVRSTDASGNVSASADATFTTSSAGIPPANPLTFGSPGYLASGSHTHGIIAVNVTGSSALDLVSANAGADTVTVRSGNGNGTFGSSTSYDVGTEPKAVQAGDLNGDGRLDLVVANQGLDPTPGRVSVLLANGSGGFNAEVGYPVCGHAHEATPADLDGDSDLDIAVVCWGASSLSVLRNNGNGTFQSHVDYGVGSAPHSVVAADFDGDLDLDLATANHDDGTVTILRNNGSGSYTTASTPAVGTGPHSIRAGDLNGDARLDLVTANDGSDSVSVLLGNGNGTFQAAFSVSVGTTPKSVAIADLDRDGNLDVITANINGHYPGDGPSDGDDVTIRRGNGNGTFQPAVQLAVAGTPFAVVAADVNADGRLDLLTANWHGGTVGALLQQP